MRCALLALCCIVALLACLGCGSVTVGAIDGTSGIPGITFVPVADVTLSPDSGGGAVPDGCARLRFSVNWPGAASRTAVSARRVLTACQEIDIQVTGLEIPTAVTTTITPPATTGSLVVPAGTNRTISFEEKGAASAHLATTQYLISELAVGQTYDLTFTLLDDSEPDNTSGTAMLVSTDGATEWRTLHRTATAGGDDQLDYVKFAVSGAPNLYYFSVNDVSCTGDFSLYFQILGTDGSTCLKEYSHDVSSWGDYETSYEFTTDGTYYARVGTDTTFAIGESCEYRLAVDDDSSGSNINLTVE